VQCIYMDNPSSRGEMKDLSLLAKIMARAIAMHLKQCDFYHCNPTNYARNALQNRV